MSEEFPEQIEEIEQIEPVEESVELPAELPVLPLKETVVFPQSMTPLAIGQERSIKLVDEVVSGDRMLALVTAKDAEVAEPGFDDLHEVGTAALVHKLIRVPDGTLRILVQGLRRIRITERKQEEPYLVAGFEEVPDVVDEEREKEILALTRNVQNLFARVIGLVPYLPDELQTAVAAVDDPGALCNLVASTLRMKTEERQELLEQANVEARLRQISSLLARELDVLDLGSKVQSEIEKGQREFFLRQQLKAIQEELGEGDDEQAQVEELRGRIAETPLSEEARKAAERELGRLEKLPSAAAEYGVIRTYLDWILSLPWYEYTDEEARQHIDICFALAMKHDLDIHMLADDTDDANSRSLEYLARKTMREGFNGRVTASHCGAMAAYNDVYAAKIVDTLLTAVPANGEA